MTYTLEQYPRAIKLQQIKLHDLESDLRHEQDLKAMLDAHFEKKIAENKDLKNEQQRKAKRLELREEKDYLAKIHKIASIENEIAKERIELEYLRNCFSVFRLNKRMVIAELETGSIAA